MKHKKSQNSRILKWLQSGHSITALQALKKFDCICLAERIRDLRQKGYRDKIVTVMVKDKKTGKRYARYIM